jgi:hypothetical protein
MEDLAPQESEVQVAPDTPQPESIFEGHDNDTQDEAQAEPAVEVDDSEEVDYEGEKYKVPKKLKDAFLRQADYTVKTQTLAQQKQEFESQQQQFVQRQQFQNQHIQDVAKVMAIDERLEQFSKLDLDAIQAADPLQAMTLDRQMRALQQQRNQHVQSIEQAQAKSAYESSQATARNLEEARTQLARDIKGFGTPELTKSLGDVGKALGYKPEELASVRDPRAIRMLHEAYLYRQLVAKAKPQVATSEAIKPITRVSGANATTTKSLGDAGLSDAEYNRMRREYIRKNR